MKSKPKIQEAHKEVLLKQTRKNVRKNNLKTKGYSKSSKEGKYVQGLFWSKKNKKEFVFRSTYEFAYFHILEDDTNVVSYIVEPFKIPYRGSEGLRYYIPDIMVLYKSGAIDIIEIKPKALLTNKRVKTKAAAARDFIKKNLPTAKYRFVTEKDIFETHSDYRKLVELIK